MPHYKNANAHPPGSEDFWEATYTFLLQHIDEGIHVIDKKGITRIYNRKMEELEAMDPKDVLNRPVLDVVRFSDNDDSTLLRALRTHRESRNVRQTYFNNRGRAITTMNDTFPLWWNKEVIGAIEIARDVTQMEQVLQNTLQVPLQFTFDRIIGRHPAFLDVLNDAKRTARTTSSVLIVGETGTGKELVAQSIHQAGTRAHGPFVSQNCAALPESLIEGLLFGTVRGAFTGAIDRPGVIEQAHGGTLLLDELNALSPALQAKLLRVLQERTVRRVGATKDTTIDTRIVATINEDPIDAIAANRLRKDLYYRLGVVTLFLPPLRERVVDIPVLTAHFIEKYNQLFGLHVSGVDALLMEKFEQYTWPGNVRELEHTIEGAMNLMEDAKTILEVHLPNHIRSRLTQVQPTEHTERDWMHNTHPMVPMDTEAGVLSARNPQQQPVNPQNNAHRLDDMLDVFPDRQRGSATGSRTNLHTRLSDYERGYIAEVLTRSGGNISAAARELGVSRQSLQYRLRKLNLRP